MATTNPELSKQLLVACDQAHFTSAAAVQNKPLATLPDRDPNGATEYNNPFIYHDEPFFLWDEGYKVVAVIDKTVDWGGGENFVATNDLEWRGAA